MKILNLAEIKTALTSIDMLATIEAGFVAYSKRNAVIPPVGELLFERPPGELHIKYGYLKDDAYYVIKIASGFYDNFRFNLPSGNGVLLIFNQKTGELLGVLLDEGYLTDLRTAVAGAIAAKYLAPKAVSQIGIIGTGTQARLQLQLLKTITSCRDVVVVGRNDKKLLSFLQDMQNQGFLIEIAKNVEELAAACNLIVTTTPATSPVLWAKHIKPGTHITAVGTDSPHKQELDENIFAMTDIIAVDSASQCIERGDTAHAIRARLIHQDNLIELGQLIAGDYPGRTTEQQITIADLSGVAVQDIQIAKAVYESV